MCTTSGSRRFATFVGFEHDPVDCPTSVKDPQVLRPNIMAALMGHVVSLMSRVNVASMECYIGLAAL